MAGGAWSYYPAPVYPYPVYVETVVPQPVVQQPVQTYYFCRSLNSYYPSVPECPEPFETITQ